MKTIRLLNFRFISSLIIIILLLSGCDNDRNKNSSSFSSSSSSSAVTCVNAKVDLLDISGLYVAVEGTVTNNCTKKISYAIVYSTCFDASGNMISRDEEYVNDLEAGAKNYFRSPMKSSGADPKNCIVEVTEAKY